MTLNTCASMKLEVHFQRKQVIPGCSRAGEGPRAVGEWACAGGAAVPRSVRTPVRRAVPGAAVCLCHRHGPEVPG